MAKSLVEQLLVRSGSGVGLETRRCWSASLGLNRTVRPAAAETGCCRRTDRLTVRCRPRGSRCCRCPENSTPDSSGGVVSLSSTSRRYWGRRWRSGWCKLPTGRAEQGPSGPVFTTDRSAEKTTGVSCVSVLFAGFGSGVSLEITAVFTREPAACGAATARIKWVCDSPAASVPRARAPFQGVQVSPPSAECSALDSPAGSRSVRITFCASAGPALTASRGIGKQIPPAIRRRGFRFQPKTGLRRAERVFDPCRHCWTDPDPGAGGYHSGIAQDVGGRGTQDALQQQCLLLAGRNNARGIRIAPGIPALAVVCGELGIQQHAGYSVAQQHFLAVGGAGVADLNGILKELAGNGGGRGSLLHNGQIG